MNWFMENYESVFSIIGIIAALVGGPIGLKIVALSKTASEMAGMFDEQNQSNASIKDYAKKTLRDNALKYLAKKLT